MTVAMLPLGKRLRPLRNRIVSCWVISGFRRGSIIMSKISIASLAVLVFVVAAAFAGEQQFKQSLARLAQQRYDVAMRRASGCAVEVRCLLLHDRRSLVHAIHSCRAPTAQFFG